MNPNGLVAAASIVSQTSMPRSRANIASSLTRATLTWRNVFSTSFASSATRVEPTRTVVVDERGVERVDAIEARRRRCRTRSSASSSACASGCPGRCAPGCSRRRSRGRRSAPSRCSRIGTNSSSVVPGYVVDSSTTSAPGRHERRRGRGRRPRCRSGRAAPSRIGVGTVIDGDVEAGAVGGVGRDAVAAGRQRGGHDGRGDVLDEGVAVGEPLDPARRRRRARRRRSPPRRRASPAAGRRSPARRRAAAAAVTTPARRRPAARGRTGGRGRRTHVELRPQPVGQTRPAAPSPAGRAPPSCRRRCARTSPRCDGPTTHRHGRAGELAEQRR